MDDAVAAPGRFRSLGRFRAGSVTEANWLRAFGIASAVIALFVVVYLLEMGAGRWDARLRVARNPEEAAARYVGISHFLLAFLFLATSRKMRAVAPWGPFAAKLAGGALLCVVYGFLLWLNPPLGGLLFIAYFLIHECRDQVHFYFVNGDAPPGTDSRELRRALVWPPFLALGAALGIAAAILAWSGYERGAPALAGLTEPMKTAIVVSTLLIVTAAILRWRALVRRQEPDGVGAFVRRHRPVFFVWCGTLLVVLLDVALLGDVRMIVLLHVTAWYVFVYRQMHGRPPASMPRRGGWAWMRATPGGFAVLHAGLALVLVLAGVVWAYGFRGAPELAQFRVLLDPRSFPFWTIVHVTLSFGR